MDRFIAFVRQYWVFILALGLLFLFVTGCTNSGQPKWQGTVYCAGMPPQKIDSVTRVYRYEEKLSIYSNTNGEEWYQAFSPSCNILNDR